jgi:cyclic beta-1,2-glucan synthetase
MAAHLLTLRMGLAALPGQKILGGNWFESIRNTVWVLAEVIDKGSAEAFEKFQAEIEAAFPGAGAPPYEIKICLEKASRGYDLFINSIIADMTRQDHIWKEKLGYQIKAALTHLLEMMPWLKLPDMPEGYKDMPEFATLPTLSEISKMHIGGTGTLHPAADSAWAHAYEAAVAEAAIRAAGRIAAVNTMVGQCAELAEMEWDFLYDKAKSLLSIGYNVDEHRCDQSSYDLLASEARLTVFLGIAQGKLPQESWFALGRLLTNIDGNPTLLSWSGSMFEYLMPLLVMPSYLHTLLDQTDKEAVERQIDYGRQRDVPWGISESCYNLTDASQNYQYHAFGVPGMGLKRGLGEDLVIAPYASALALMVAPERACHNMQLMSGMGFEGKYGLYESIDYTPSRQPPGQEHTIIRAFMAHHQGMSFLSLSYLLLNQPMQARFEAEPQFQATLLLLQERIPKATSSYVHTTEIADIHSTSNEPELRIIRTPDTVVPSVQLLSNGNYHVMVTNAGGGYSRWRNMAITRWREDTTCDNWGAFCYIRDLQTGSFWSMAHQPSLKKVQNYEASFSQGRADFHGVYNNIEVHTDVVVSPEDDIEIRRIHITNRSGKRKVLDITSYAEVVIAPAAEDSAHPAFSDLFVQTEILQQQQAILCTRRPKTTAEKTPWMFHLMKLDGTTAHEVSYETDRMEFIGRGNTVVNPKAMQRPGMLGGGQGSVLDPIVSIRYEIILQADESVTLDMIIGAGDTREACQSLIDKYQDKHNQDRVFELAWTHSQVVLRQINASEADAQLYSRLAGSVLFMNPAHRGEAATLVRNQRGQAGLWPYSISGDLPIVLLKIEDEANIEIVRQLVQAHAFWRLKGLAVDLVIWNESHGGYRQGLQNQIAGFIASQTSEQPGGIFVRNAEQISNEDRVLFHTVARVVITDTGGSLTDHINRKMVAKAVIPFIIPAQPFTATVPPALPAPEMVFYNGLGGFSTDGREYIMTINNKKMTPAPWANVLANPNFGTIISESGQSYTWSENAHEFRLTPWNNDPVTDAGGEVFYLRDEETGHYWSPAPLPQSEQSSYITRHGFGYSSFEHHEEGIHSVMTVYVDTDAPIKFISIKIKNTSGRSRKISATGYAEWVLGELRPKTAMYIISELDPSTGAIFARNPYNTEFAGRVGFFDTDDVNKTYTGDRTEFIGRNGTLQKPDAMSRIKLSGKLGAGLDPCVAIQVSADLFDGQEKEIIFKLGAGKNTDEAISTVRTFKGLEKAHDVLDKVKGFWEHKINSIQVETPDQAVNLLANGWLTYQVLSSRLWGRSGYYQSGGAYGFRDQLQDTLSLMHVEPLLVRQQIMLCASRQYKEGDVQHWWHPPVGRGVRTRCSDDYLWLPFITARYVTHTGDIAALEELAPFLEGRLLNPDEETYYELPGHSELQTKLYDHCVRAITHGLTFGVHGLPLMGTGDWNDGMDNVGRHGKGESVWLAFFLYDILMQFAPIATLQNDTAFADRCLAEAKTLKGNIDKNAWDGEWYRRAYFDDGSPLGSATNAECQIDSISQSWSVLSGGGETARTHTAMESAYQRLVKKDSGLIQLLTPPFDKAPLDPGYIKGYVPGVRENGGQYTHSAVWLTLAFARMGDNARTWELLNMINPINHGKSADRIATYKVEPYVIAADVYSMPPHVGRGGWTWYTGSAGWMSQLISGALLGLKQEGSKLSFGPCVPADWQSYVVHYRYGNTMYHITFSQQPGPMTVSLDGAAQADHSVTMVDDGIGHVVLVSLASAAMK